MIRKLVCTKTAVLITAVLFAFASFATTTSTAAASNTIASPSHIGPGELPWCPPEGPQTKDCK